MPEAFEVLVNSVSEVKALPGIWPPDGLRRLLILAEIEDAAQIPEADLHEMTLMALQDLGNQRAGERVLEVVFGDAMRPGVRQNLVDDLQQDEPWEDFAVVAQQRGLFVAVVLLQQAFPNRYAVPEALRTGFEVRALGRGGETALRAAEPAWLVRLLACGLPETSVLHRLYEDELAGGPFPDAPGLLWHLEAGAVHAAPGGRASRAFELTTSRNWFEALRPGQSFQASPD